MFSALLCCVIVPPHFHCALIRFGRSLSVVFQCATATVPYEPNGVLIRIFERDNNNVMWLCLSPRKKVNCKQKPRINGTLEWKLREWAVNSIDRPFFDANSCTYDILTLCNDRQLERTGDGASESEPFTHTHSVQCMLCHTAAIVNRNRYVEKSLSNCSIVSVCAVHTLQRYDIIRYTRNSSSRATESYANVISSVYKLPQYEKDSEKGNIELKNGCR